MESLFAERETPPQGPRAWRSANGLQVRIPSNVIRQERVQGSQVILVLDYSGSMSPYKARLNNIAASIARAAIESGSDHNLAVVVFGDTAATLSAEEACILEGTDVSRPTAFGDRYVAVGSGTRYGAALSEVCRNMRSGTQHLVLFMTDGAPGDTGFGRRLNDTDFRPILFSPSNKGDPRLQDVVTVLYDLQKQVDGTPTLTRDNFLLHNLNITTGSDELTVALQHARYALLRRMYASVESGREYTIALAPGNEDAVGFIPLTEQPLDGVTEITVCVRGDSFRNEITLSLVEAPNAKSSTPSGDVLLELEALLNGDMEVDQETRTDICTRARTFIAEKKAEGDPVYAILESKLLDFEQGTAELGAAAQERLTATSMLQTSSRESILTLVRNIGSLAAVGSSNKRAAISRLQRLTAGSSTSSARDIATIQEYTKVLRSGYPSYLREDLYLAELSPEGDLPVIVIAAPGCEIGATTSEEEKQRRVAVALNHADCARLRVQGWMTSESLLASKSASLEPLRRRLIVLVPTSDPNVLRALAKLTCGVCMLGELIPLPFLACDGLSSMASAILDEECTSVVDSETCVRVAAYIHLLQLYRAVGPTKSQFLYTESALCPIAASRPSSSSSSTSTPQYAAWIRSLRCAVMHVACNVDSPVSLHALIAELVRKRVTSVSRRATGKRDLHGMLEQLLRVTGLGEMSKSFYFTRLSATTSVQVAEAFLRSTAKTGFPIPESIPVDPMLSWLDEVVTKEESTASGDAYAWEESPSFSSLLQMYTNAVRLQRVIPRADTSAHGWVSEESIREMLDPASLGPARERVHAELSSLDGRKLFDMLYQTCHSVDQKSMTPLAGLKYMHVRIDDVPPHVQVLLMQKSSTPGDDFDVALSSVIRGLDGTESALRAHRKYIPSELLLHPESRTRLASLERGYSDEVLRSLAAFAQPGVVQNSKKPCTPGSRDFTRKLNFLCRKFDMRTGHFNGNGIVSTDSNMFWINLGVTVDAYRVTHINDIPISNIERLHQLCLPWGETEVQCVQDKRTRKNTK